jgi:hypothetical protein
MYRLIASSTKLSQNENKLLESAASETNTTKSAYLRSLLLDKLMPQTDNLAN